MFGLTRWFVAPIVLLTAAAGWAQQSSPERLRAEVEAVAIDVRITEKHRRPVYGLTAAEFEVFEDGFKQNIPAFTEVTVAFDPRSRTALAETNRRSGELVSFDEGARSATAIREPPVDQQAVDDVKRRTAGADQPATPLAKRSYAWYARFLAVDESSRTATISARIPPHVERYVERFKAGERLVLVWDMIGKTEADRVLAVWQIQDAKKSGADTGYILPIEFVSADLSSHTMTFKAEVSHAALKPLTSLTPGQWIKGVTPMLQPTHGSAVRSIEQAAPPPDADGTPAA